MSDRWYKWMIIINAVASTANGSMLGISIERGDFGWTVFSFTFILIGWLAIFMAINRPQRSDDR